MNLSCLDTFLAVVRTGNLNRAAEQLNVTQSTVTARLDTLEASLGCRLLIRSRRGAELTRAGFVFQRHAELMVRSWELARRTVGLPTGFAATFSFVCHRALWDALGSHFLERVLERQSGVAVEAWPGDMGEVRRWLASGLIDAALVPSPLAGRGLLSTPLAPDRLVQVATVRRKAQRWDPAYIFVDHGAEFRRQHTAAWPVEETARVTFGASRWALDHLLKTGGSAYLPLRLVQGLLNEDRLHRVEGAPEFTRPVHFVWREESLAVNPWIENVPEWS